MSKRPSEKEDQTPQSDERNIVKLDSTYEGASLEDRLFLIWNDYKNLIIGAIVIAFVALVGWGGLVLWQDRREAQIRADYQEAVTIEEKQAFGERYAPHPLAGTALLEVADYHFENENYSEAAGIYRLAADSLADMPLEGRALVGRGVSLGLDGHREEALQHLRQVGANEEIFRAARAEAYYHAAVLAAELDREDLAIELIELVGVLDPTPMQVWAGRATELRRTLPGAAEADLPPEEFSPMGLPMGLEEMMP